MITHIDEMIGEIVDELQHLGLDDDTIIAFVSDHGDMLGERQMWFKRTFHEPSVKVPFIFHCPKRFAPRRVSEVVSLADLCPTFAELAGAKDAHDEFGSGHSQSFAGLLQGDAGDWKDEAVIEYLGPGVEEPWLALRKGDYKYVYCRNAPSMLFNIAEDPDEMVDLSDDQTLQDLIATMHARLFDGIDIEALTADVIKNKQTRLFIDRAMKGSEGYRWDHTPDFDGSKLYVRGVNKPATV
jgi:choline-sulfatase